MSYANMAAILSGADELKEYWVNLLSALCLLMAKHRQVLGHLQGQGWPSFVPYTYTIGT